MDGDVDLHIEPSAPFPQFPLDRDVARPARAITDHDLAELGAAMDHLVDQRAKRREADRARDEQNVAAAGRIDRPTGSERSADPDHRARPQRAHRLGHRADLPDRMHKTRRIARIAADADGDLADAGRVEHVELSRRELKRTSAGWGELPGEYAGNFALDARYAEGLRRHRIGLEGAQRRHRLRRLRDRFNEPLARA